MAQHLFNTSSNATDATSSTEVPAGIISYASICFLATIIFTCGLVWTFSRPKLPPITGIVTFVAWLCSFCVCFLVPLELISGTSSTLNDVWNVLFWVSCTFLWFFIPFVKGYCESGGFTIKQKCIASARSNLLLISIASTIIIICVIYLRVVAMLSWSKLISLAVAVSNVWGLCCLILMAGYGLVEFPRFLWHRSQLDRQIDKLCYCAVQLFDEMENAKDEMYHTSHFLKHFYSRVERTNDHECMSNYQTILNEILEAEIRLQSEHRRVGVVDRNTLTLFDTISQKSIISSKCLMCLNAHVKNVLRHLSLVESKWNDICKEYTYLDTVLVSSHNSARFACYFYRLLAILAACMSILLLWMELIVPFHVDLSPLSAVIHSKIVNENVLALQLFSVIPISYLSVCTYFPLFRLRIFKLYYMHRKCTDESTLLFNSTFILRAATPLAYNFALLLKMDVTALKNFIGQIDLIPFFGSSFTLVFPWFIVLLCLFTLVNGWSFFARLLNIEQFQYLRNQTAHTGDPASEIIRETIEEGRHIITRELQRTISSPQRTVHVSSQSNVSNVYELV